ncbi:unnamed protein product, partial [Rotaria socialis]
HGIRGIAVLRYCGIRGIRGIAVLRYYGIAVLEDCEPRDVESVDESLN